MDAAYQSIEESIAAIPGVKAVGRTQQAPIAGFGWDWMAFREGSVPEVLDDGVTGFICHFEDELVSAVERLDLLDRAECRRVAERRFSPAAMADGYERLFSAAVDQAARAPESAMEVGWRSESVQLAKSWPSSIRIARASAT